MQITYKEFFEKSKTRPYLQKIFNQCLTAAINVALYAKEIFPDKPEPDVGDLALTGLESLARIEGIILTDRKEVTAEYMSEVINSYGRKMKC